MGVNRKLLVSRALLTDNETDFDLLSTEAIANTIISMLLDNSDQPVTIGVHGDWGAGKSSVLEMIDSGLSKKEDVLCLKFNGWRFQGFEDAKIALLEGIVTSLVEKRPALTKAANKAKEIIKRINWLKVAQTGGSIVFSAVTGIPDFTQIKTLVTTINTLFRDEAQAPTRDKIQALLMEADSLIKPGNTNNTVPEEINEFRKTFNQLLEEAKIKRLIVLVDDLDRCLPETAIETLEAIRLFVFTSKTAFVIAADESMIEYAVRRHFPDYSDSSASQTYTRKYLEKLIQVPFRIPPLGAAETRIYVTLLLVGNVLGEGDPDYLKLVKSARDQMKRPWVRNAFNTQIIHDALGDSVGKEGVASALSLSEQIGSALAGGTNGNPRQIKRFVNTMILRKTIADARGYGDDIILPVLAKFMLAERFLPELFEQIAMRVISTHTGICEELAALESYTSNDSIEQGPTPTKTTQREGDSTVKPKEKGVIILDEIIQSNPLVDQWTKDKKTIDWARIQPPLSNFDLRPYLFVSKEKTDYFSVPTLPGDLGLVVERLLGPKFAVQAFAKELESLTPQDASQVFEATRNRIMNNGLFETEPKGVAGLKVLVQALPFLQPALVSLLESLPADKIGAWAVTGWSVVVTDPDQKQRLTHLFERWTRVEGNIFLSSAAKATLGVNQITKRGK